MHSCVWEGWLIKQDNNDIVDIVYGGRRVYWLDNQGRDDTNILECVCKYHQDPNSTAVSLASGPSLLDEWSAADLSEAP